MHIIGSDSPANTKKPRTPAEEEVAAQLGDAVDLILDAGPCPGGQASTVVDCTVDPPKILREGPVTADMLGIQ